MFGFDDKLKFVGQEKIVDFALGLE